MGPLTDVPHVTTINCEGVMTPLGSHSLYVEMKETDNKHVVWLRLEIRMPLWALYFHYLTEVLVKPDVQQ